MLPRAELFAIGGKYAPFSDDVLRDNSGQMLVDIKAQAGLGVSASLCKTTGGGIAALAGLCIKAKLQPIVVHDSERISDHDQRSLLHRTRTLCRQV